VLLGILFMALIVINSHQIAQVSIQIKENPVGGKAEM